MSIHSENIHHIFQSLRNLSMVSYVEWCHNMSVYYRTSIIFTKITIHRLENQGVKKKNVIGIIFEIHLPRHNFIFGETCQWQSIYDSDMT